MIVESQNLSTDHARTLMERLVSRQARVAVVGLGYVGLSLAAALGRAGFQVEGIEVDLERVSLVNGGASYIGDVPSSLLADLVARGRLTATTGFEDVADDDVVVICVPTPLRKSRDPDISFILGAMDSLQPFLRPGQLLVLESTTYPGTTEEVLQPRLEARGFRIGSDYFLAFSPERVDPGNRAFTTENIPKVVGGVSSTCTALAAALYGAVTREVHPVSGPRVAETAKLLENTFRSVNIALANELALACRAIDVDPWEVIRAAATKPFGFMPFYPGPGIGGHCIPLDPLYLSWKVRLNGFEARFIGLADEINRSMPRHVVGLLMEALNDQRKCLHNSKILVLGVTYKRDVNDVRESPAVEIVRVLAEKGARVDYVDPFVPQLRIGDLKVPSTPFSVEALRDADCVLVLTDHSAFDYAAVARSAKLVIDTRNAMRQFHGVGAKIVSL